MVVSEMSNPTPYFLCFISTVRCCRIYIHIDCGTFHVSVIDPDVTMVVYGILFGGVHPTVINSTFCFTYTQVLLQNTPAISSTPLRRGL